MRRKFTSRYALFKSDPTVTLKSSDGTVTKTGVALLDEAGRQEEIARMLSGAEVTPEARAQADRLLEGA